MGSDTHDAALLENHDLIFDALTFPLSTAINMPKPSAMWFVNEPQPLHHATAVKRFQDMPESFTARALVPFVLLIGIDGSFNPEGLLTLEWGDVERRHPIFGGDRWRITARKDRAAAPHRRSRGIDR